MISIIPTTSTIVSLTLRFVFEEFKKFDKEGDGQLSLKEIRQMLYKLNVKIPNSILKKKFQAADVDKSKSLQFPEFLEFYTGFYCLHPRSAY